MVDHAAAERPTVSRVGYAASVRLADTTGMINLKGDMHDKALASALRALTGFAPPAVRTLHGSAANGIAWMAPDELLLFCEYGKAEALAEQLRASLAEAVCLIVDMSDARARIVVEGHGVRDVLAKLSPADLSRRAQPGLICRTRLGPIAAAFWLVSDKQAEVICFRSFQQYMLALLQESARDIVGYHNHHGTVPRQNG